jgi:hypothetical protein
MLLSVKAFDKKCLQIRRGEWPEVQANGRIIARDFSSFAIRILFSGKRRGHGNGQGWKIMITVKSTQKTFTEDEISSLTGICSDHLRIVARSKHLGSIVRAAGAAGGQAERWLFSNADLSVLTALFPRCEH